MARVLGLILLALSFVLAAPVRASSNPSYDSAMTQCVNYMGSQAYRDNFITGGSAQYYSGMHCAQGPSDEPACTSQRVCLMYIDSRAPARRSSNGGWNFFGAAPSDQEKCMAMPQKTGVLMAAQNVCVAGCNYSPSDDGGRIFTVKGIDGSMRTAGGGTYAPTGATCGGGPSVPDPPSDPMPPRKLCGGGSCHDVAAGQFCAVNGAGQQVCIADKPPTGSPGGCVSMGDTTLCAGNPPPLPPSPPIADPASQITASDKYTETGASVTVNSTVNNYNQKGSAPNNGAGADDNKPPASSSSSPTPGDGTRAAGGGDCNTPPMCEGSAATCMVATQTYLLRCPPGGKGLGPGEGDGDTTVPGLDGIGEGPGEGFMRSETVLDKLDTGGLGGGGQCPALLVLDLPQWGIHSDGQDPHWCDILGKAGYMLMFLAAYISLRILSEK